jgi:hypothetical protein
LFSEFKGDLDISIDTSRALSRAMNEKIAELKALSEVVVDFGQTFGAEDIPSSGSPRSHMLALSGHVRSKLREAVHTGMKRTLSIIASHYEIDLEQVCEGYILHDEDDLVEAEVQRVADVVEGSGSALARRFKEDVVRQCFHPTLGPTRQRRLQTMQRVLPLLLLLPELLTM